MKNKNIYFCGYYLGIEAKEKYIDLFESNNKTFYEASMSAIAASKKEDIHYLPEQIYKVSGHYSYLFSNAEMNVDSLLKECYKKDLKHFLSLKFKFKKLPIIKKYVLLFWFIFETFSTTSKGLEKLNFIKFFVFMKKSFFSYKHNETSFINRFKKFIFRKNFIIGYKYSKDLLDALPLTKNDIFILWGKSYSGKILLLDYLKRYDIPYFISEYGEVSGTISCSPHGIFGESFNKKSWSTFEKKEILNTEISATKEILDSMKENQISTREYDDNMYFLMKFFYQNSVHKEDRKKVVYVNGAELYSSGLYWNRWNINSKGKNPNKMLLEKAVNFFNPDEYMIVYKEHPMTIKANIHSLLSKSDFPTVNFLGSMNIHDVLDLADIIVTFPSKVVMTALLYEKTIFVLGDFTMPHSIPEIKYFTSRIFEDIKKINENTLSYNPKKHIELIAKLVKHSLIVYDDTLYNDYDVKEEQEKLKTIIEQTL